MRIQALHRQMQLVSKEACSESSKRLGLLQPMKNSISSIATANTSTNLSYKSSDDQLLRRSKRNLTSTRIVSAPCAKSPTALISSSVRMARGSSSSRLSISNNSINRQSRRGYVIKSSSSSSSSNNDNGGNNNKKNPNSRNAHAPLSEKIQQEMDQLLATALTEADQISALVMQRKAKASRKALTILPKVSPSPPSSTLSTEIQMSSDAIERQAQAAMEAGAEIQDEVKAVEALLKLTDHPHFKKALAREREKHCEHNKHASSSSSPPTSATTQNVELSLHSAFILVVNWLCTTLKACPSCPPNIHIAETNENIARSMNFPALNFNIDDSEMTAPVPVLPPLLTKESILLSHILDLTDRIRLLNLPLTIPQYQTIASMIARHSSGEDVIVVLLDLSTKVSELYGYSYSYRDDDGGDGEQEETVIKPSFFEGALKELLERNRLRDMIELFHGMRSCHDIVSIDTQTGMELLKILKKKLDDSIASGDQSVEFDDLDVTELAMILQTPLMEAIDSRRQELENYQDLLGETVDSISLMEESRNENETIDNIVESSEDGNSELSNPMLEEDAIAIDEVNDHEENEEQDEDMLKLQELVKIWSSPDVDDDTKTKSLSQAMDIATKIIATQKALKDAELEAVESAPFEDSPSALPLGIAAKIEVDEDTGAIENIEISFTPKPPDYKFMEAEHQNMLRGMIYTRDSSFEIPDIVEQLEEWNSYNGLLFTKEYEDKVADEIAENNLNMAPDERSGADDDSDESKSS
eukprot:CAMPEP_0194080536 /NCGR_PEP_ID=MMETSP0149-20130528/6543_1 /TAXON_ID=122233 /ORGANISM="Chaetoceros debilis, Strain MM31A-1" /LENGTH=756 /DNA_ID=CAMNT_0038762281 /DNA_START=36 /DNA_END=2306 /DNA_ORIENTATION=-